MNIRIISTPPGEAPEPVRAAWIGLVLPLALPGAVMGCGVGVLTGPKTMLGALFALLSGRIVKQKGYVVNASKAIEILDAHAPDAAKWWRENAARSIRPGKHFLFAAEACQEVTT